MHSLRTERLCVDRKQVAVGLGGFIFGVESASLDMVYSYSMSTAPEQDHPAPPVSEATCADPAIGERAIRAGGWVAAAQILARLVGLAQRVILARLIVPGDLGRTGVALLVISGIEILSNLPLYASLIQRRKPIEEYLNTLWTLQLIRGLVMSGLAFVAAPALASLLGAPEATWMLRALGAGILLRGMRNPALVRFRRDIDFRPQFVMGAWGNFAGAIVAVALAFATHSAWALVAGIVSAAAVQLVLSYLLYPYRPALDFSASKARSMLSFGGWIWATGMLTFVATQGDDALVSRVLGATNLAYYQLAFWLANLPASHVCPILSQITFPAYSRMEDDVLRLTKAFMQTARLLFAVTIPFSIGLFLLSRSVTLTVFGPNWQPMIPVLRVFALSGFLRAAASATGPLFLARGKAAVTTHGQVVRLAVMVLTIWYAMRQWGLAGAAVAVACGSAAAAAYYWHRAIRVLALGPASLVRAVLPAAFGAAAMVVGYPWVDSIPGVGPRLGLLLISLSLTGAYLAGLVALDMITGRHYIDVAARLHEHVVGAGRT